MTTNVDFIKKNPERFLFCIAAVIWLFCSYSNYGFLALDEYIAGTDFLIPAQKHASIWEPIEKAFIRTPVPNIVQFLVVQTGFHLGAETPLAQYRFLYFVCALWSLLGLYFAAKHAEFSEDDKLKSAILVLFGFHLLSPYVFSRSMVEVWSATPLVMSSFFACRYWQREKLSDILWAVITLVFSCQMRFASGFVAPALLIVTLIRRHKSHITIGALVGLAGFLLTGWLDYLLRGEFHFSLKSYIGWNLDNFEKVYGKNQAFYVFIVLLIGLTVPPTFVSRFKGLNWKKEFAPFIPALLYLFFFVFVHSLGGHKEDRFMIPILPVFFVLLAPLACHLWRHGQLWRRIYYFTINLILMLLVSLSVSQNNVIGFALFVEHNPRIKKVVDLEQSLTLFPKAFILREVEHEVIETGPVPGSLPDDCSTVLAVREDIKNNIGESALSHLKIQDAFAPGLTEALIVKLNPKKNGRRATVYLYTSPSCVF